MSRFNVCGNVQFGLGIGGGRRLLSGKPTNIHIPGAALPHNTRTLPANKTTPAVVAFFGRQNWNRYVSLGPQARAFPLRHATTLIACHQQWGIAMMSLKWVLCVWKTHQLFIEQICQRQEFYASGQPQASSLGNVFGWGLDPEDRLLSISLGFQYQLPSHLATQAPPSHCLLSFLTSVQFGVSHFDYNSDVLQIVGALPWGSTAKGGWNTTTDSADIFGPRQRKIHWRRETTAHP